MKKIKNSFTLIFIILLAIVLALVISSFIVFYINFENNGKIASGIFIKNVNVSRNDKGSSKKGSDKIYR